MTFVRRALLIASVAVLAAPSVLCEEPSDAGAIHDDHDGHDHDHDHDHGPEDPIHAAVNANLTADDMPPCAMDPGSADCVSYDYPDALALQGVKRNCEMMNFMVSCDILEACEAGELEESNPHCDVFDLLASSCKDEGMSQMAGCKVYTPMCLNESSVVGVCEKHPGVPSMVNTTPTVAGIVTACDGSDLPGCAECTSQDACADPLESLNLLCSADSSASVCTGREEMCVATGDNLSLFCEGVEAASTEGEGGSAAEVTTDGAVAPASAAAAVAAAAAAALAALL